MIQIEHLNKVFGEGTDNPHHVLHDIDLTINDGDVFGIIGSSGAGKSTLVRCLNLLERPSSGRIIIDGQDISGYSGKKLLELRSSIGMIFQNFSLFQQRTVMQNVTFPLELQGVDRAERIERAKNLIELVGLSGKKSRYPSELSGGQQQRVAIARALINRPEVILCDEATSALDSRTTIQILGLLKDINERMGVTLVVITHALSVAEEICDRVAMIDGGRIVEQGTTHEVFSNPQSDIAKELLAHHEVSSTISVGAGKEGLLDAEKGEEQ